MHNIDKTKLSRDYTKEPLAFGEKIAKSDLLYLYIEKNLSAEEICQFFKCSTPKVKRSLKLHGIKKSKEAHELVKQRTFFKKYGVEKLGKSAEIRAKINKTCLERYGVTCSLRNTDIAEKAKRTCRANHGVDYAFQSSQVRKKAVKTLLTKYGVDSPLKSPVIKEHALQTSLERYGVTSYKKEHYLHKDILLDNDKFSDFIKKKNNGRRWTTNDLSEYFNISISAINIRLRELDLQKYIDSHTSKDEKAIIAYLENNNIDFTKFRKDRIELDIYIPSKKLAIEFNGNYWHSTENRPDKNYHVNKSEFAWKNGLFLYHIFEYDWLNRTKQVINQLNNLIGLNKTTVYARKCKIKDVCSKDAYQFLEANHLQGNTQARVRLGLYYNDELVSIMTFGKPRFNKKYQWELVRFCSKSGTNVVGGASRLFKYFIRNYNPNTIISYSDIAKTKGTLYGILGFTDIGRAEPNYVWVNHNTVLSRYKTQKHILIKQGFSTLGKTEKEIMEARNFAQVFDCGTRVHVWRKTNGN